VLYRGGGGGKLRAGWGDQRVRRAATRRTDLVHRDGALALLVVNHAGRGRSSSSSGGSAGLAWRGCVASRRAGWWNEVAGAPDGGYASHMMPKRGGVGGSQLFRAAVLHRASGYALRWSPGRGFAQVAGSEVVFANGIAVSPDGASLYVNSTLGGGLRRVSLASGAVEAQAALPALDNLAWGSDGQLYAASLTTAPILEVQACNDIARRLPGRLRDRAGGPTTLAHEVVYRGGGAPMGAGTVGLRVGDELFIGSFAGDRVLRVALEGAVALRSAPCRCAPCSSTSAASCSTRRSTRSPASSARTRSPSASSTGSSRAPAPKAPGGGSSAGGSTSPPSSPTSRRSARLRGSASRRAR
jgi:hypothetical protein